MKMKFLSSASSLDFSANACLHSVVAMSVYVLYFRSVACVLAVDQAD